jgi:maltooligosyltrehalose trehalohydrolase
LASLPDPAASSTYERSKLHLDERQSHREDYALHRDLISLRRCDPVLSTGDYRLDGAVLGDHTLVLRFFAHSGCDRLLVANLGPRYSPEIVPEPLLAPSDRREAGGWRQLWHSEDVCYGGRGGSPIEREDGSWRIPAESATLLASGDE